MRGVARAAALALVVVASACSEVRDAIVPPTSSTTIDPGTVAPLPLTPTSALVPTTAAPEVVSTEPPLTAPAGELVVDALRLGEGGLGRARFGTDAGRAEEYFFSILGPPDEDTDWGLPDTAFGRCPGRLARVQRWGQLLAVYTDTSRYGAGRGHLSGWVYGPAVAPDALYPEGLAMSTGIGPGAPLVSVTDAFPGAVQVLDAEDPLPPRFRVGTSFAGWLTGITPLDTITSLEAGDACVLTAGTDTTTTAAP